jgi:uncharacterized protein
MLYTIMLVIFITLFLLFSHFISTSGLKVNEINVEASISDNFHGLKIIHLSDIHYGRTTWKKDLDYISKQVNLSKPDIIVITGDLIDRDTKMNEDKEKTIIEFLNSMNATLGKYAIKGNHDAEFSNWEDIIKKGDFSNIDDDFDLIYKDTLIPFLISGVSTNLMVETSIEEKMSKVSEYLSNEENVKPDFNLLLVHEPDYLDKMDLSKFDLILAGHSHNGQFRLPLLGAIILPEGAKEYYEPYYKIQNKDVYISSGIGTSTLSFRLFNRPSINLYRIIKK